MHAAEQYPCPVPTCERAKRAFPREYNMADHIQRVHKDIDAATFLKKGRRSRKISHSGPSSRIKDEDSNFNPRPNRRSRIGKRYNAEKNYKDQLEKIALIFEGLKGGMGMYDNQKLIRQAIGQLKDLEQFSEQVIRLEND